MKGGTGTLLSVRGDREDNERIFMKRTGFIAIVGRPNVGKSTILNAMMGEKISIVSKKPQTTRNSIRGIYTRKDENGVPDLQMVFIDTPGIHKARNKLGSAMTEMALNTFREVDLILFLVDGSIRKGPGDRYITELIRDLDTPKILVINKIDGMGAEEYRQIFEEYVAAELFVCFLRETSHKAGERLCFFDRQQFRHHQNIFGRYFLRQYLEIPFHFRLFHFSLYLRNFTAGVRQRRSSTGRGFLKFMKTYF